MTFDLATGRRFPTKEDLFQWARDSGSRPIVYTPDFELRLQTGPILVEVKHAELIARAPQILAYPGILARYGFRLVILDDRVLHDAFVRNIRALTMAWTYSPGRSEIANLQAESCDCVSLGALRDRGYPDALVLGCLARGHLTCDVQRERITKNTLVRTVVDKPSHLMELPLDACCTS
ncbi:Tn7 transposase TnsA N-terminal domain-containing protein [Tropicimonas sp. IMCC34011]|uniref:Tn7 transposase TnsA N-terminal domain-containing protein n=1 Tax=Tropicimonas sp. IMCC34011 TaxID=2248759 RepID=UPI001E3EE080|nr:Tn7 transposase TnsA N-terminal domain-containing protein [Tropicimonas sp. IMCC34011]